MTRFFITCFAVSGAYLAAAQTVTFGKGASAPTPATKIETKFNHLMRALISIQCAPASVGNWTKEEHLHLFKSGDSLKWSVFLPQGIRADYNARTGGFLRYICNAAKPNATSHRTNHVAIPGTIDWRSRTKDVGNKTGLAVNLPFEISKKNDRWFMIGIWSDGLMVEFDRKSGYVYRLWYAEPKMFGAPSHEGTLQKPVY